LLPLPWRKKKKKILDINVLRKNDISLLILDERWNKLFTNTQKSSGIEQYEKQLKDLMKEQARLLTEQKTIAVLKKNNMDKIINLTPEVFEKNDENAKIEMQLAEKEIKRINNRVKTIEDRLNDIPDEIKQVNLRLLEETINVVYFKIRSAGKRVKELEELIDECRAKLKQYIDEKESLAQDDTEIYSYFHDLLGAEELERLDKEYFRSK
jgi:phage terminase Nu1 subunit (DNA packaging protein)